MKRILLIAVLLLSTGSARSQGLTEKPVIVPSQYRTSFDTTHRLFVDDRFEVSLYYYGGLKTPRFMAQGSDGKIYVADMGLKRIMRLDDLDGDGVADTAVAVTPQVDSAHSLAFYRNYLFVAEASRVRRFEDLDHDGFYETESPFITGIADTGVYNHWTRTIYIDSTEGFVYVTVGASCNACREADSERASVLRFNLDGSEREVYASGLRNALGITKGANDDIWVANADRDVLGEDHPREMITHIHQNGFYGWPFAYEHGQWDDFSAAPEYSAMLPITRADSARVATMDTADVYLEAHTTPMQLVWDGRSAVAPIDGPAFYVAIHGSSSAGRPVAHGYKMMRIERTSDALGWTAKDFVTGFLTDSAHYKFWARPCGLVLDAAHNTFYLGSDAGTAAIFKIRPTEAFSVKANPPAGGQVTVFPNPAGSSFSVTVPDGWASPKIEVFDLLGRAVSLMVLGENSDRTYRTYETYTSYSTTLEKGTPPGIYLCRVSTATQAQTLPIILR